MNETSIQHILNQHFSSHQHRIPNTFMFNWESDFFTISKAGYAYEFEIKCSRPDFRNDFLKDKHRLLKAFDKPLAIMPKNSFHRKDICHFDIVQMHIANIPNKFFFVCQRGLIPPVMIPPYAGLLYIHDGSITVMKEAPLLHKRKLDFKDKLLAKYYWDCIRLRDKAREKDREIKYLTESIKCLKEKLNKS